MFLQHFVLNEDPFGVTPDPRFLYFGREHREALSSLYYSIVEGRGFSMMVAAPGMGKTTLLHYLQESMKEEATFAWVSCSFDDRAELLQAVMTGLGAQPENGSYFQNWTQFQAFLIEQQEKQRKVVLICDEAQSLTHSTLENIRLLSNLETKGSKLLQILLAGQPDLIRCLKVPRLEQLAQRINLACRINPLAEAEIEAYIQHRLGVAGCQKRLLTREAVSAVGRASGGIPRRINTLCYNALTLAWVQGREEVGEEQVRDAATSLSLLKPPNGAMPERVSVWHKGHNGQRRPEHTMTGPPGASSGERGKGKPTREAERQDLVVGRFLEKLSEVLQRLDALTRGLEMLSTATKASSIAERPETIAKE